MIIYLCLLKLSLLPHCFLVQIGTFILLSFNGGQGVKPCKRLDTPPFLPMDWLWIAPRSCTTSFELGVHSLFFLMPLQSSCMRMRQWCLHSPVKDSNTCRCLDLGSSFFVPGCQHNLIVKLTVKMQIHSWILSMVSLADLILTVAVMSGGRGICRWSWNVAWLMLKSRAWA